MVGEAEEVAEGLAVVEALVEAAAAGAVPIVEVGVADLVVAVVAVAAAGAAVIAAAVLAVAVAAAASAGKPHFDCDFEFTTRHLSSETWRAEIQNDK